jgi:hypothetical protein
MTPNVDYSASHEKDGFYFKHKVGNNWFKMQISYHDCLQIVVAFTHFLLGCGFSSELVINGLRHAINDLETSRQPRS